MLRHARDESRWQRNTPMPSANSVAEKQRLGGSSVVSQALERKNRIGLSQFKRAFSVAHNGQFLMGLRAERCVYTEQNSVCYEGWYYQTMTIQPQICFFAVFPPTPTEIEPPP
jgi:hypothetical protein